MQKLIALKCLQNSDLDVDPTFLKFTLRIFCKLSSSGVKRQYIHLGHIIDSKYTNFESGI
jgi:hypothetical protein